MHGQRTEDRQQNWHMWSGPSKRVSAGTEPDSACLKYFTKAGRKIGVGDCALFRADGAPFFIGLIKKLSAEKEGNLKLSVNWLYRLGDIKLGKGASFEAAPNEIFYSFHEDEISAAALLHPCKVAFLQKGVELPSSVSSFVCRRVYDIANKRLYWLTDQDYTDEHQAEVDLLLDRTKHEMQATPSEGPSQRVTSSPSTLKHETVSASLSMQGKSKKRPRTDHLDSSKREKLMKVEDSDAKREFLMKFEDFASIANNHEGLMNVSFIEQLFQVMLQERSDGLRNSVDTMSRRTLLVSIIAATEEEECLTHFVQLGGLRILNDWLQEAHKGKVGDGSPKDGDTALEELLLTLIRGLAKLPVDLDALKSCIVGKSVNKLRSHRNPEIQKKAKELVDTWKKRVNAEMKSSDEVKTSTTWPSRPPSESLSTKIRGAKIAAAFAKPATNGSNVIGDIKAIPQSMSGYKEHLASKDSSVKSLIGATNDVTPVVKKEKGMLPVKKEKDVLPMVKKEREILSVVKEEKSCSSSQSQNNSQSWCSGSVKGGGTWKDDVKPVISVAPVGNKSAGTMLRNHGHSAKSHSTVALIGPQKDSAGKHKGEKSSSASFSERGSTEGARVELNNQRLILRLPNPGRSPSHSVSGGSLLDGSATINKGSSPGSVGRHDHAGESIRAAPVHPPGNIGEVKCGKSSGAIIREESDRSCIATPDCKPLSFEHRPKDLVGKCSQGNMQKSPPSLNNLSHQGLVPDPVQGGIDLLASVAAREVLETEKDFSGCTAGEGQPVTTDSTMDSPMHGRIDSRNQQGDRQLEGAHAVHEKVSRLTQQSELPANSVTKGPSISIEAKVLGDGVTTRSVSLVDSVLKEASPPAVSCIEGVVNKLEHRGTSSNASDSKEIIPVGNCAGTSQGQTSSSLNSTDEGCEDAEEAPLGCAPVIDTKGIDSLGVFGEDALEVARQVAKEVEEEVEKYCTPDVEDARLVCPSNGIPSCENALTRSDRFAPGDAEAQSKDFKPTDLTTDVAQVSVGADVPTESIQAPKEGMSPSERSSNVDELSSFRSDDDAVRQCVEAVTVPKEVSDMKETVSVVTASKESTAKEESATNADADTELKVSRPEKISSSSLDDTGESKDAERPVFDLNEGLVADEVLQNNATLTVASPPISAPPCSDPSIGVATQASSLAVPIAVVAASKGAFIPPSNLIRIKGELGWKGSAATSAFRPAEPRRMAETSQPTCDATASTCASIEAITQSGKQPRILDIDLNIADDRVLEDSCVIPRFPGVNGKESLTCNALGASRPELDLNRVDGNDEQVSSSMSISRGAAVPSARANVQPPAAPRVMLDFDLNDGLGFEEEAPPQPRNLESSGVFAAGGIRENTDIANATRWYSAASSMPAAMVMPAFPSSSRPEASYPVVAAPGSKSVMNMGHTFGPFSNDIYRGAPVSSSAVPYVGSIPASFSYAGLPFGAGFPFTSASYNMGSPLNSSASSPPFLTATPSQLVSAGAVVSPYGRPYLMGSRDIPGIESNASWVRPGLDLNTGPEVGADLDTRESTRASVGLGQLSYQQAASLGGTLKRKEPEGSFDPFRSGFKQTAWR